MPDATSRVALGYEGLKSQLGQGAPPSRDFSPSYHTNSTSTSIRPSLISLKSGDFRRAVVSPKRYIAPGLRPAPAPDATTQFAAHAQRTPRELPACAPHHDRVGGEGTLFLAMRERVRAAGGAGI